MHLEFIIILLIDELKNELVCPFISTWTEITATVYIVYLWQFVAGLLQWLLIFPHFPEYCVNNSYKLFFIKQLSICRLVRGTKKGSPIWKHRCPLRLKRLSKVLHKVITSNVNVVGYLRNLCTHGGGGWDVF
jgi:hypothetical protein